MLLIQILIIAFALFALYRTVGRFKAGELHVFHVAMWIGLWASVIIVVVIPQVTSRFADIIGVGRGVDAVLYFAVLFLIYSVFRLFVRLEQMERDMTKLVRHIGLAEMNNDDETHDI